MKLAKFATARGRWTGVGPYYAMFPALFCDKVVQRFTREGELVLDPFGGRGTSIFSAASLNRRALGIELNPVGWIYGKTKLFAAREKLVTKRLESLAISSKNYSDEATQLPRFFSHCYHKKIREFLLAARQELDWKADAVDRTLMSLILVNLHGKKNDSLSNQMRQTKAMAPGYALRWWRERELKPPQIDAIEFLRKKIRWRYAKGVPACAPSEFVLGDSSEILKGFKAAGRTPLGRVSLLLTSPPYFGITNYHYDQWLRLWLLGGSPNDGVASQKYTGKFCNRRQYEELLSQVFGCAADILATKSTVYVRTDRREPTYSLTRKALITAFPNHELKRRTKPFKKETQTALFGHFAPKFGEVDLVLTRS